MDPISTEGLKEENTDELIEDVRSRMVNALRRGPDPI